jgi:hypothetical protein
VTLKEIILNTIMVKEPAHERESAVKKRRKGGSSTTSTNPAKVPERDIYKVC